MRKREVKKMYTLDYEMNSRGKVVEKAIYIGDYYEFQDKEYSKSKVQLRLIVNFVLIMALFVLSAFLDTDSSRFMLIGVPLVFIFLPVCYMLMGNVSLVLSADRMTKVEYVHSIERIHRSSHGIIWVNLYIIAADIIYTMVNFSNIRAGKEILFVSIHIISLLFCWFQIKYIQRVRLHTTIESQQTELEPAAEDAEEEPSEENHTDENRIEESDNEKSPNNQ